MRRLLQRQLSTLFSLLLLSLFPAGCGPVEAVDRGRELFSDARLSVSPSNVFACSTCHAIEPHGVTPPDGLHRPGYTMAGAAGRPSFWGGNLTTLFDAVNFCVTEFMRGDKLSESDTAGLALLAYLRSISPAPDPAQPVTLVQNIDATYMASLPAGDARRGESAYRAACGFCHGDIHTGSGRLGTYVSEIPDDTVATFGSQARAVIAEKVRHGKFFGIGGNMPLYSRESLADTELADILAYLLP